ncbi:SDH family Clp fold serine proteinase [Pseudomonas sp. LRF_L74]|uniref:SDH family Clp fold serine proteinase n=1 Tax=Pseudomonas sp. LRF_L74 TaxID=3369422 RepID=UPI003F5EDD8B
MSKAKTAGGEKVKIEDALHLIGKLSKEDEVDCYLYIGGVKRLGYERFSEEAKRRKHKKAYLFLSTYGGEPATAYRIARGLRHYYEHLTVVVPAYCKSAGTLLAIGADHLIISDKGELGPLDMQLKKPDELFDMSSGLDITQAMAFLRAQSAEILKSNLVDLNVKFSVTTKTAADIATKLAIGLVSPIYAQIDPYKIGESQRAINVAFAYGKRLNDKVKNLKSDDSLKTLVLEYPDHGFVIDRKEASTLFNKVSAPQGLLKEIADALFPICKSPGGNPIVFLIPEIEQSDEDESTENVEKQPKTSEGSDDAGSDRATPHRGGAAVPRAGSGKRRAKDHPGSDGGSA